MFAGESPLIMRLRARRRARGLTLVEVLIVVGLIAILSSGVLLGSGALGGSRLRAGATLVMSMVRAAQTRANATGRPTRVVLDLDYRSLWLEETNSTRMLRERDESEAAGAEPVTEAEQAAHAEAKRILDGPRAPRARFRPVSDEWLGEDIGGAEKSTRGEGSQGRTLDSGIRFAQVQTEHDEVPRVTGRAYLYFWPGGRTETAAIQLSRGEEEAFLTVRVSGLTGRARIESGRVELPSSVLDGDYSEREEE